MLGSASLDALQRIADRASDVLSAYAPGAVPRFGDVARTLRPLPAGDPLSVAAAPGTWFVALDERGERTYTRAGSFHFGADGALATIDGAPVLGTTGNATVLAPLRLPEPDRTLGRCDDVHVDDDGTVAYTRATIDPRTRERTAERIVVGRIALARFPAGGAPQRIDATHARAVAGVIPHLGAPGENGFAPLMTQVRDAGAIDIDTGLQRLSDAYVAFSALQQAYRASGESAKVVMDLLK